MTKIQMEFNGITLSDKIKKMARDLGSITLMT